MVNRRVQKLILMINHKDSFPLVFAVLAAPLLVAFIVGPTGAVIGNRTMNVGGMLLLFAEFAVLGVVGLCYAVRHLWRLWKRISSDVDRELGEDE